jgi:class 3 adenylate cyclase
LRGRAGAFEHHRSYATFPGPARAIRCAKAILSEGQDLGLELRAGVHTGECEAIGGDLGGLAVHIGARVSTLSGPGQILVSGAVKDLVVGSGLRFADRGEHELKGVPGRWHLFAVSQTDEQPGPPLTAPADHMTMADRATVRVARRAPGVLRAVARVTQRSR